MPRVVSTEPVPVSEWLVLGSFPLLDRTVGRWTHNGFPSEANFAPREGEAFNGAKWFRYESPHGRIENHDPAFPYALRWWCFAYACTYIHSPTAQKLRLFLGSDNGVVVWLNGREVHRIEACGRGVGLARDVVPVTLARGWTRMIIKMPQGAASWGMMAHFAAAAEGKLAPKLRFSTKCPAGKAVAGLKQRRAGVVGRWAAPPARATSVKGRLTFELALDLFNDSPRPASRIEVLLSDGNGKALAKVGTGPLPPFTARGVVVPVDALALIDAMGNKRSDAATDRTSRDRKGAVSQTNEGASSAVVVKSSLGTTTVALPDDALARLFCLTMTDLAVELPAKGENRFAVPEMFAGQSARVETFVVQDDDKEREFSWPALPTQDFTPDQTRKRGLVVTIRPPVGMKGVRARILFGSAADCEPAPRLRLMLDDLGLHPAGCADAATEGWTRLRKGDTPGAWRTVRTIADRIRAATPDRKGQHVTLVGHAHIDMNWLWTYEETLRCCYDTFRQVLAFCREYPDFCFSQSQASVYEMIERFDPAMFEDIRRRVAEGRWELLSGFLTEGDANLASGEGLARALLIGQRYFRSRFGRIAHVGWLPDNFGHPAQLPQILRLGGMGSFYAHRCQPKPGAYVWEGADGSRVITYATPTYNGVIDPSIRDVNAQYDPKHGKVMWIYGVGDHGGGPTRRDIERAHAYNESPGSPTIRCGTAEAFFRSMEPHAGEMEVHRGELQFTFPGCYTSIARIKKGNRDGENLMYVAEMLAALATLYGDAYPQQQAHDVWHKLAFNQFHDILCGSATRDSNRESIGRYDQAICEARRLRFEVFRRLTTRIDTQSCGQPVVVFNPLPRERSDIVEAELFSYQLPPTIDVRRWWEHQRTPVRPMDAGKGPYPTIHLVDFEGKEVPAQIVDSKLFPNGHRIKVQFPADRVPACGHKVYHAFPAEPGPGADAKLKVEAGHEGTLDTERQGQAPARRHKGGDVSMETPFLRVEIDGRTGHVKRIYDKRRKCDVLRKGERGNVLKAYMEKPHGMSAWEIGPVSTVHTLNAADSVTVLERGPVRACVQIERLWNRSKFVQRVIVYRDVPRIEFELDVVWFELGDAKNDAPMLRVAFPANVRKGTFTCDTPFAAVERPATGIEVPAQKWVDLSDASGGVALLNDSKYGHRCDGHVLEMTLLRASYDPDLYPDQGPHSIRYALLPHAGDWRSAGIADAGVLFNSPLTALEAPPHPGELPPVHGYIELGPDSLVLSGVKKPEDGQGLIVRFYEIRGKACRATLRLPKNVRGAQKLNLLEDPLEGPAAATCEGNHVSLDVRPHEIVTLRVEL